MGLCYSTEEAERRVLILGLDNAGKTTLIKGMLRSAIVDERGSENKPINIDDITGMLPTQGFMTYVTRKNGVKIVFTDVGGARDMRHAWRQFYREADAVIYVVDCSDRRRLEETGQELSRILEEALLVGLPLLIFANKSDIADSLDKKQITEALNIRLRDRAWVMISSSGKTGEGIQEGVQFLSSEKTVRMA